MSITELRTIFKEDTGNYSYTNTQIDRFLNRGIKILDSLTFTDKKDNRLFVALNAGSSMVVIPGRTRVIRDVWIQSATERKRIPKTDLVTMRYRLENETTPDFPTSYCPVLTQINADTKNYDPLGATPSGGNIAGDGTTWRIKEFVQIEDGSWQPVFEILGNNDIGQQNGDLSFYLNWGDVTFDSGGSRALSFHPVADQTYYVEIFGLFQTPALSDTVIDNWWTINHKHLVSMAAQYAWDSTMRNLSSAADLLAQITLQTTAIIGDAVEEEWASEDSLTMGD